jgi:hypothetical protein
MSEELDDRPFKDSTIIVGDSEFQALQCTGDYDATNPHILSRQEGNTFYFVWRRSEWERYEQLRREVEAEIADQEAANPRRGM